jgi:hypothetical protein
MQYSLQISIGKPLGPGVPNHGACSSPDVIGARQHQQQLTVGRQDERLVDRRCFYYNELLLDAFLLKWA